MTENVTNPLHTLREDPLNAETTIRELIEPQQPNILLGQLMHFREYLVTKPLPTKGSEADLYLIQKEGQDFILKLYRNAMAPKQEVLNKIWALSRENPHQLVSILDVGFDAASARWYEIMEYLPLGSLRDIAFCWSDRRSFVLAMIHELTRSLHLLHQNEIVHCDLKPSNVLIRSCNPLDLILTDFGIASQMASGVSLKMTSHKGTPMYWAPEAFSGLVAPASDWAFFPAFRESPIIRASRYSIRSSLRTSLESSTDGHKAPRAASVRRACLVLLPVRLPERRSGPHS